METIKDNNDPPEDYWKDYEDENEDEDLDSLHSHFSSRRLVEGISIKDLCDGKEVIFETDKVFPENDLDDDNEIYNDVEFFNIKSMRENRGAPPLNCSFKEIASKMTNITEDGFVKKQVVSNGVGKIVPKHAYVTVHYNLYKESCELPFDSTYLRNRPEKLKLDQGEAILGLEIAIKSMKKNENSMFFIKWEVAFGELGCPDRIEGRCDIVADIKLMNFMEIQFEEDLDGLSASEKNKIEFGKFLNQAKKLLCSGSDEVSKGDTKGAIRSYRKAFKILDGLKLANEEEENVMLKQKVKCLVNLAICYNKIGRPEQACVVCQEALSIDSNNVKANFHYGRASITLSNFALAQRCLLKADKLKPNDKDINMEIKKLNDKKALYEAKDKIFWKKAFTENVEQNSQEKASPLDKLEEQLSQGLKESLKNECYDSNDGDDAKLK